MEFANLFSVRLETMGVRESRQPDLNGVIEGPDATMVATNNARTSR
jgi:hypothetical protein